MFSILFSKKKSNFKYYGIQWGMMLQKTLGVKLEVLGQENLDINKDYIFITNDKFDHLIKFGDLLEYEWVHGNRYGTLYKPIEDALDNGDIMLIDVDVKGAMNHSLFLNLSNIWTSNS